jgi:hypothetical protein
MTFFERYEVAVPLSMLVVIFFPSCIFFTTNRLFRNMRIFSLILYRGKIAKKKKQHRRPYDPALSCLINPAQLILAFTIATTATTTIATVTSLLLKNQIDDPF